MNIIDDFEIIDHIPEPYPPDSWVSIDLEIFGGVEGKLHRPIGEFACLALTCDGKQVSVLTDLDEMVKTVPNAIKNCGIIFQGGMFDIRHLRRWISLLPRERYHDTLYIDRLLYGGYYSRFGLNALTRRHLNAYLDKEARDFFSKKDNSLSQEMIRYNARDAVATYRIAMSQMSKMKKSHRKVWYEIDGPAVWAILDFKGVPVNKDKWIAIADEMETKAKELENKFSFNPRSVPQVKKFFKEAGVDLSEGTGQDILEKKRDKHPLIADLADYRKFQTRVSRYGRKWAETYIESDGRAYSHIDPNIAEGGRTSASDPAFHQIPVRDTPVYRETVEAQPGYKLVGGDFAQQEIRNCAYLANDENLIALFQQKEDIYSLIATEIHGRKIEKKDKERQDAKGVVLGAIYYLTAFGLARKLNNEKGPDDPEWTEERAQELLDKFFNKFQKVKFWMEAQQTKIGGYVRTPAGRKTYINEYSYQAPNNACNAPNQGGGADMMKYALVLIHRYWNPPVDEPFPVIMEVHDEIILEVLEANADYAADFLRKCMIEAGEYCIPGIPVAVDVKIGCHWGEIH